MVQVGLKLSSVNKINGTEGCTLSNVLNNMTVLVHKELTGKDAPWILTTAVITFTMQTGKM